jgi:hypothetical protein
MCGKSTLGTSAQWFRADLLFTRRYLRVTVRGQAWTGVGTVARVEVSGKKWATARLTSPASQHTWRSWESDWRPTAGERSVMVRATDSQGRTQPMNRDKDRRSYEIDHVVPTAVVVRDRD